MSLDGSSGGRVRTASRVSTTLSPPNGARAGQEGIEDGAQAVDVAGCRHRPASARGLLGSHVRRGAKDGARLGQLAVSLDLAGQAEVGDVRPALVVDQDIGWLEVAVKDAPQMGVVDGLGRLGD